MSFGKTVLTFASGEEKVITSKLHVFIAAHPVTAVLIALAVGLGVGLIL